MHLHSIYAVLVPAAQSAYRAASRRAASRKAALRVDVTVDKLDIKQRELAEPEDELADALRLLPKSSPA